MKPNLFGLLALAALAFAGFAAAQDEPRIDQISAGPADATTQVWTIDREELARLYPAVARAVASPNFLVDVADAEQESTRAFFAALQERAADAILVDGEAFTVGISIASGGVPPAPVDDAPDAESHSGAPDAESHAPARDSSALLVVAGLALLVAFGGVGVAALAIRRR